MLKICLKKKKNKVSTREKVSIYKASNERQVSPCLVRPITPSNQFSQAVPILWSRLLRKGKIERLLQRIISNNQEELEPRPKTLSMETSRHFKI